MVGREVEVRQGFVSNIFTILGNILVCMYAWHCNGTCVFQVWVCGLLVGVSVRRIAFKYYLTSLLFRHISKPRPEHRK